ncbi:MAG: hypothetical protein R6X18_07745 [Chloroflexota bacterium]
MRRRLVAIGMIALFLLAGCAGEEDLALTLLMRGEHVTGDLPGDVYIAGGEVAVPAGVVIGRSVYLFDGSLALDGEIGGDVFVFGGRLALGPAALVNGDLRLAGGTVERAPGATIGGTVLEGSRALPLDELMPERSTTDSFARWLMATLPLSVAAYVLGRRSPQALSAVSEAALSHPIVSLSVGALAAMVLPALMVAMVFTLVLIPLALLLVMILALVIGYGAIALGWRLGGRLRRYTPLSEAGATGLGTLLVMLALFLAGLIPLAGGWLGLLVSVLLLGAVFLTRFGARPFVPAPATADRL